MTLSPAAARCMVLCVILGVGSAAGCDKASDQEKKANVAQLEADEKIALATAEARDKIAEAQADFVKLREDYRHATTTNLVDLDRDVDAIEARAKLAVGKEKADLDARLAQIGAGRKAFVTEYESLDAASGARWDETKARLDKQWSNLKTLVDER